VAAQVASIPLSLDLGQLAYVQGGDIWIMTLLDETSRPQRLTTDGRNLEPRWSPSGQWLAFRKEREVSLVQPPVDTRGFGITVLQRQVWLIRADGSAEYTLNQGSSIEAFAWSPTSDRLAYTTPAGGLNTINADGSDPITLIPENPSPPSGERQVGRIRWSPNGNWIAYELRIVSL
jgi:Tol biopolymer transport system component